MQYNKYNTAAATLLSAILISFAHLSPAWAGDSEAEVKAVIAGLESTWNNADMDGYLAAYSRGASMSLTYGNSVVQGWDALNNLFSTSYPDEAKMGKFTIDSIAVTIMGDDAAIAYGNFTHVFADETIIGGYTHVLMRDTDGSWIIQHERTSRGKVITAE